MVHSQAHGVSWPGKSMGGVSGGHAGVLFLGCELSGCKRSEVAEFQPTYGQGPATAPSAVEFTIGIFPLRDAAMLLAQYQPLVDEINHAADEKHLPHWRMLASSNHDDLVSRLRQQQLSVAIVNPGIAIRSESWGYRIFAKQQDDQLFRGIILIRKGSDIHAVNDLRGKKISFPSRVAVGGTMLNKLYLYDQGLNVEKDAFPIYAGSHDSSILNVLQGVSDAAGTLPQPWERFQHEHPEAGGKLQVQWQTPPLVQVTLIASARLPDEDMTLVRDTLSAMSGSAHGRAILKNLDTAGYEPADSSRYDSVRKFLDRYAQAFGNVID